CRRPPGAARTRSAPERGGKRSRACSRSCSAGSPWPRPDRGAVPQAREPFAPTGSWIARLRPVRAPIPMLVPAATRARALLGVPILALFLGPGCIGHRLIYPMMPTGEELREFEAAGPADVQSETLEATSMRVAGPYHVVSGD